MSMEKATSLIPSQQITLFQLPQRHRDYNPEELATNSLLEISAEDYLFDPTDVLPPNPE